MNQMKECCKKAVSTLPLLMMTHSSPENWRFFSICDRSDESSNTSKGRPRFLADIVIMSGDTGGEVGAVGATFVGTAVSKRWHSVLHSAHTEHPVNPVIKSLSVEQKPSFISPANSKNNTRCVVVRDTYKKDQSHIASNIQIYFSKLMWTNINNHNYDTNLKKLTWRRRQTRIRTLRLTFGWAPLRKIITHTWTQVT